MPEEGKVLDRWLDQLLLTIEKLDGKIEALSIAVANLKETMISEKADVSSLHEIVNSISDSLSKLSSECMQVKAEVSTIKLKLAWGGVALVMIIGGVITYLIKAILH